MTEKEKDWKLDWDNSRYTKEIDENLLNQYTDEQYETFATKMDQTLLHAVSEQRCRPFGCRLQNCLGKFSDLSKCMTLYRQMNYCVEKERKKTIYEYITTNRQPNS